MATAKSLEVVLEEAKKRPEAEVVFGACSLCKRTAIPDANFCVFCGATFLTARQIEKGEINSL